MSEYETESEDKIYTLGLGQELSRSLREEQNSVESSWDLLGKEGQNGASSITRQPEEATGNGDYTRVASDRWHQRNQTSISTQHGPLSTSARTERSPQSRPKTDMPIMFSAAVKLGDVLLVTGDLPVQQAIECTQFESCACMLYITYIYLLFPEVTLLGVNQTTPKPISSVLGNLFRSGLNAFCTPAN